MSGIGDFARSTPDAPAIITLGSAVSFAELDRRQRRVAAALRRSEVTVADRIAVASSNRAEYLEVTIGALRAGIVPVPIHASLTPKEVQYMLEDSAARWFFTEAASNAATATERVVTFGDAYERLLYESEDSELADFVLARPMHYTSGTTGKPKGVWVDPVTEERAAALSDDFRNLWGLSSTDVHLVCSPLSHSAPHRFALRTLEAGGTVVVQPRFDAAETLAAIELFGVTTLFVVPTHLERMVSLGKSALARHDLGTVRLLVHAGAPIRVETKRRIMDLFPPETVWEFYGSTEGQATRISPQEWRHKPGSVGRPREGALIAITGGDGAKLPPGRVGDVWIDDPRAERFVYWRDRAKTDAAWRDGAFTVGDQGRLDTDGYLYLTGRRHDVIISGGVNVYPQEVEAVLQEHPSVAEVLVYGSPHPEWGQQVRAMVVPAFAQPLDPDALRRWARGRLAGFKCPKRIDVVDSLPHTPTGKIKRPG